PFVLTIFFDPIPFAFDELQCDLRRDRPSFVIRGFDLDPRIISFIHDIFFGMCKSDDTAAGADETRASRHFTTRGDSDLSFDAVPETDRLILISLRDLEWNLEPPLRIEPGFALFHHIVAVTVRPFLAFGLLAFIDAIMSGIFVITIKPPMVIAGTI